MINRRSTLVKKNQRKAVDPEEMPIFCFTRRRSELGHTGEASALTVAMLDLTPRALILGTQRALNAAV